MKLIRLAFATAIAMCIACGFAFAQPQNQGQNNRQQQRASAMMQTVLVAIASQSDVLQLVFRKDVQLDLKMDLGQRNRFDNLHDRQVRDLQQARMQNRRNQAAVTDLQAKQRKEVQGKIDELLSDSQKKRLNQISLQLQGNSAVFAADIQKQLGISDDQRERIKQVKYQRDQTVSQLPNRVAAGEIGPQDVGTEVQQAYKDANDALADVLTTDQAEALQKLFGPLFKAG